MSMVMEHTREAYEIGQVEVLRAKTPEEVLGNEVTDIERQAASLIVADDTGYARAAEMTQAVQLTQKKVTEYWEPLRVSTKQAYDDVLGKKKQMLTPLNAAEATLKGKMAGYVAEKERQRREQERLMRVAAEAEMKERMVEAETAMDEGNEVVAEYAIAEAEVMEGVVKAGKIESQAPKAEGVSLRKGWEIINIDSSKVPVELNGVEIRPVDTKVVMNLIKASKGKIQIPGIQYRETVSVSVRT